MPSNSAHNQGRHVVAFINPDAATLTSIKSGTWSSGLNLGLVASGSTFGDPETQTDSYAGGEAEAGATQSLDIRVLGKITADLAALQTAKDANPPTPVYIGLANNGLSAGTLYGPGNLLTAFVQGKTADPSRQGSMIKWRSKGDTSEDIMVDVPSAITLPA